MTIEIRQTGSLTDAEEHQLYDWGDDIFGASSLHLLWRPKEAHFLMYVDGKAVSCVGVLKHIVSVGEQPVTVGGVGGVVTRPEEQRRGHARQLMQRAAGLFEEWGVDAGLLFCFRRMVPFYQSLGWKVLEQPVVVAQPAGEIASPMEVMVLTLGKRPWPDGVVRLNSLPW